MLLPPPLITTCLLARLIPPYHALPNTGESETHLSIYSSFLVTNNSKYIPDISLSLFSIRKWKNAKINPRVNLCSKNPANGFLFGKQQIDRPRRRIRNKYFRQASSQ